MATETKFFLVDRPGTYGDRTKVRAAYETLPQALAAAQRGGLAVYEGPNAAGSEWLRVYEEHHPRADRHLIDATVVTWQSPRGGSIDVSPRQEKWLKSQRVWPHDYDGQEYCTVSHGAHRGTPTFDDATLLSRAR